MLQEEWEIVLAGIEKFMPELPEVQAVVDSLQQLKNNLITNIEIKANVVLPNKEAFTQNVINKKIKTINRRGKGKVKFEVRH